MIMITVFLSEAPTVGARTRGKTGGRWTHKEIKGEQSRISWQHQLWDRRRGRWIQWKRV